MIWAMSGAFSEDGFFSYISSLNLYLFKYYSFSFIPETSA